MSCLGTVPVPWLVEYVLNISCAFVWINEEVFYLTNVL
jgi:hypothetical protein